MDKGTKTYGRGTVKGRGRGRGRGKSHVDRNANETPTKKPVGRPKRRLEKDKPTKILCRTCGRHPFKDCLNGKCKRCCKKEGLCSAHQDKEIKPLDDLEDDYDFPDSPDTSESDDRDGDFEDDMQSWELEKKREKEKSAKRKREEVVIPDEENNDDDDVLLLHSPSPDSSSAEFEDTPASSYKRHQREKRKKGDEDGLFNQQSSGEGQGDSILEESDPAVFQKAIHFWELYDMPPEFKAVIAKMPATLTHRFIEEFENSASFKPYCQRHHPTPHPITMGYFCALRKELLIHLLLEVKDCKSLLTLSSTCKDWRAMILSADSLWSSLCESNENNFLGEDKTKLATAISPYHWYQAQTRPLTPEMAQGGTCGWMLKDGWRLEGEWDKGNMNGYGVAMNIACSEHLMDSSLRDGETTMQRVPKLMEGNFKDGILHGKGRRIDTDGVLYVGFWNQGKRHGNGSLSIPHCGAKYSGVWKEDVMQLGGRLTVDGSEEKILVSNPEDLLRALCGK